MAIKDGVISCMVPYRVLSAAISTNTTTTSAVVDTKGFDFGNAFYLGFSSYTDGSYTFTVEESEDNVTFTEISIDRFVGNLIPTVSADTPADGSTMLEGVGVFGNKRYLRLGVVSTGVTTGATVECWFMGKAETRPVRDQIVGSTTFQD